MIQDCARIIQEGKDNAYLVAAAVRAKGLDPSTDVELTQAKDLADRVEGLVGTNGCAPEIRRLIKEQGRDKASLMVMDSIMDKKYGNGTDLQLAEQAVRTAITMLTEGIVVAGTEGIARLEINKNPDGSKYMSIFFASPIRSAGGSAGGYATMLTDYARRKLGLQNYRATESEIDRYIEEITIYDNVEKLQYFPKEDEIRHTIKNCPICVDGDQTTQTEVSINKNVERVKTNCLRGGMCLVLAESITQKAPKLLKFSKKLGLEWDWLEGMIKVVKKSGGTEIKPLDAYLSDIIGGRPIFAYPSRPGAFRLRYGRARNTGINARAIHPAAMYALDEFPAIATQLKVERPKKGCAVVPCDSIEPPVVRLKNGDVVRLETSEKAKAVNKEITEILFLGDMLVSYGDFLNANHPLIPSGICEDWWELIANKSGIFVDVNRVTSEEAVKISKEKGIPLHPRWTYFYADLTKNEIISLRNWLKKADVETIDGFEGKKIRRLKIDASEEKRLLERLCVPHKVRDGFIIIDDIEPLEETLALRKDVDTNLPEDATSLELVNKLAPFPIYNKAPVYIGCRMGRPEKAKERMMSPAPHGLFPVGNFGGKTRTIPKAAEKGKIVLDMPRLKCPKCKKDLLSYKCPDCGERAVITRECGICGITVDGDTCPKCGKRPIGYRKTVVNLKEELEKAQRRIAEPVPDKMKGVIGTVNPDRCFEPLEKVILRAKYNVYSFKDGTARFDASNIPVTHVRATEIGTTAERLRSLGYTHDYLGKPLEKDDQIIELWPQDILLSDNGADYLGRVARFVDDLLEKHYGMARYYNIKKKDDLIGQLIIGMAPHISAGSLGRIIGFTRARGFYAHPYFHCACRRDCDGDEDSVTLLMDALINFSRRFISSKAGGTEDIPQILSVRLDPTEIDDQAHDIETITRFPIEFYEATQKTINPADFDIPTVKRRLGKPNENYGLGFMFDTTRIDEGPTISQYAQLKTMVEKVDRQLALAEKIRAVDEKDVAMRVINFHFLRDIYGNLRSFGQQAFRCVDCNESYRRPPLVGKCLKCGGKIILTVHKGGIEKYLSVSQELAEKYGLGDYLKQRLKLVERDLEEIFFVEPEKETQYTLADFA
ncbi:DNA polymerase II large subunit [Candidatus Micrarchaeota archaeon]|nr:DNA polymerase II large subunit [Candidatus Micrarchaeota archaeon]